MILLSGDERPGDKCGGNEDLAGDLTLREQTDHDGGPEEDEGWLWRARTFRHAV